MNRRYIAVLFFAGWILKDMIACQAIPDTPASKTAIPVEVIAAGGQCFPAPETWTATWISSSRQLQETLSRCRANRIGAVAEEAPSIDFDRFGVLAVEMGERPSAGYGFEAGEATAFVENQTATVRLVHNRPPPGAATAQVMTAPWILIRMPLCAYREIRVTDQDGRTLTRAAISFSTF